MPAERRPQQNAHGLSGLGTGLLRWHHGLPPTHRRRGLAAMKNDLDTEKRAMIKIWSKREKQIERALTNSASMYGDVQGIIGASLPEISSLELGGGMEEEEDD